MRRGQDLNLAPFLDLSYVLVDLGTYIVSYRFGGSISLFRTERLNAIPYSLCKNNDVMYTSKY